ncbi:MAG: hypothetical protein ACRD0Q_07515 [Acidimicrobiales bacterium]
MARNGTTAQPLLLGVEMKLRRAQHHLDTFAADIAKAGKNYHLSSDFNTDKTEVTLNLELEPFLSLRWGTIVGDYVHNARSALDHLVFALATQGTGLFPPPNEKRIQFPIADSKGDWGSVRTLATGCLGPALTEIERAQPYHAQNVTWHPLAYINWASNRDKHRLVNVVPSIMAGAKFDFNTPLTGRLLNVRAYTGLTSIIHPAA